MAERKRVAVVGAGIVGTAAALALAARGHVVALIDPDPPGAGASYGNAGGLSAASIVPLAGPGAWRALPGWLRDPLGPFAVRWRHLPRLAPWLLRFAWAGALPARIEAQARALRDLNGPVMAEMRVLAELAGAGHLIRQAGHLTVYRDRAALEADRSGFALRQRFGYEVVELDDAALRNLEPALSPDYRHGVLLPANGHCTDPGALAAAFAAATVERGGSVRPERVTGFDIRQGRALGVLTDRGRREADAVVIAAGAFSGPLARAAGDDVPLETERGYHLQLAHRPVEISRPIFDGAAKFATTPMAGGLRVAGTVELASLDAAPDWRRAELLYGLARRLYPALPPDPGENRPARWMGHRPSLPDSLPAIGPARGAANVFHAFGHGHTGLTGSAMTARIVADLVDGRAPPIDIRPFRPDRFRLRP